MSTLSEPPLNDSSSLMRRVDSTLELSAMARFGVAAAFTVFSVSRELATPGMARGAAGAKLEPSRVSMEESMRGSSRCAPERSAARGAAAEFERVASPRKLAEGSGREESGRFRLRAFMYKLSAEKTYSCFHPPTF